MAALIINYIFKGKIEKITNIYIHLFQGNIRLLYKIHTLKLLWRAIGKVQIEDSWLSIPGYNMSSLKNILLCSPMIETVSSSDKGCWSFKFTKGFSS